MITGRKGAIPLFAGKSNSGGRDKGGISVFRGKSAGDTPRKHGGGKKTAKALLLQALMGGRQGSSFFSADSPERAVFQKFKKRLIRKGEKNLRAVAHVRKGETKSFNSLLRRRYQMIERDQKWKG